MTIYSAPQADILLALKTAGRLGSEIYADLQVDDAAVIIEEAGRFAAEKIAPLNLSADMQGSRISQGKVTTPDGFKETYKAWCEAGWNAVSGPVEHGGQGLPMVIAAACTELWNASSLSFAVMPLLTTGAIEAINAHASDELKQRYLPTMIAGTWTGTMNLTEPQAGSDLSGLRCKAERHADGTYRIIGGKIFITYGEHDCAGNIIHLVLARLPDAPAGTRGISLFLVPKILPDGSHNDLRCHSIEHKLGLKASPTCTMIYGDQGGAMGWLIGEENRGLNCMFTMMNNARLLVGVQGVGVAERALQGAKWFASERKQGKAPGVTSEQSAIIDHPDVRRMLNEMQCKTMMARMLCMATASAIDEANSATDQAQKSAASARAGLLTPLAKSYSTDIAVEVASLGVQIHGGMGFVEETGAAQHYRDARILPIYEGTNGIQAIDLVMRKLPLEGGAVLARELDACAATFATANLNWLQEALAALRKSVEVMAKQGDAFALAHATPFQRALAVIIAARYLLEAKLMADATPSFKQAVITEVMQATAVCAIIQECACL